VPERPALYYFDTPLSFRDIDRQSNSLAQSLRHLGVQPGARVALYLQNIPQFWLAELAAWKAGAIVVPLNPMLKERELEHHLRDSGSSVLIALESLVETAQAVVGRTQVRQLITTSEIDWLEEAKRPPLLQACVKRVGLDTPDLRTLCVQSPDAPDPHLPLEPGDVALLTYTSGTTGPPKGAMNTHANIAFNAEVYRHWMQLGAGDVIVGMAPLFHITGLVSHLAVAGLTGLPVLLSYRFDAGEILRQIEHWRGTFTVAAITAYQALLNHADSQRRDLRSLRKAYSGGAPIAPHVVKQLQAATGVYIHNIYGLTETSSPSHAVPLGKEAPVDPGSGTLSVGVPIPNTLVKVVDVETGRDLPAGTAGELLTKGPGVVPGYWQQPAESARSFRDGWFATGDVGKMDENGWFYLVDRHKDMIIASGYKVWPREVEDVLCQHEAVREAAVVGVPDPYRGESVKAFVALKSGHEEQVTPEALVQFCKERLAAYKYPRQVEIVAELPKTASGKILRRELRR
jgi:long-chain acyl-CoA synthetase